LLQSVYQQLACLYELPAPYNIDDFLITDRQQAGLMQNASIPEHIKEQLLVAQGQTELDVALFMDDSVLLGLHDGKPAPDFSMDEINNYWLVVEGVSHFLYLTWRGHYDRPMTQMEMELQADIDKYLCSTILLAGADKNRSLQQLHVLLFERSVIHAQQSAERYTTANRYAAKYCYALQTELRNGLSVCLLNELRRFYRLSQHDKLRHIQAC
jgi:hypothetical protein